MLFAVLLHGVAQEAHLRIEALAHLTPSEVQRQQRAVDPAERALLHPGDEAGRPLAVDEMAENLSQ